MLAWKQPPTGYSLTYNAITIWRHSRHQPISMRGQFGARKSQSTSGDLLSFKIRPEPVRSKKEYAHPVHYGAFSVWLFSQKPYCTSDVKSRTYWWIATETLTICVLSLFCFQTVPCILHVMVWFIWPCTDLSSLIFGIIRTVPQNYKLRPMR